MELLVNQFAGVEALREGKDAIKNLERIFSPFKKPLTNKERRGLRAVGTSRYGLAKIIERIAGQYDHKLPKEDSASAFSQRIAYLDQLRHYIIALQNHLETMDDTEKAVGKDIMACVDKYSSIFQIARKHDGDLDLAMKELDEYNTRFGLIIKEEDKHPETGTSSTQTLPKT